jgi:hypothetical protein
MSFRPLLVCALSALVVPALPAQIVASERAMVAQTVDGTRITVDYSRPRARSHEHLRWHGEVGHDVDTRR